MQSSQGLHFEDVVCGGLRAKHTVQNSFSGVRGPLREGLRTNSHECCQPASAGRVPVRTGPPPWHGPGDLGTGGVTREPPEGWAEAPAEEPRTLPL